MKIIKKLYSSELSRIVKSNFHLRFPKNSGSIILMIYMMFKNIIWITPGEDNKGRDIHRKVGFQISFPTGLYKYIDQSCFVIMRCTALA